MLQLKNMTANETALSKHNLSKMCNILLRKLKDLSFFKKYSLLWLFL